MKTWRTRPLSLLKDAWDSVGLIAEAATEAEWSELQRSALEEQLRLRRIEKYGAGSEEIIEPTAGIAGAGRGNRTIPTGLRRRGESPAIAAGRLQLPRLYSTLLAIGLMDPLRTHHRVNGSIRGSSAG